MDFELDREGLSRAAKRVLNLPGVFRRATKSALKSTGWMIRFEMRDLSKAKATGPGKHFIP